jgi:transposase-like protein
VEPRNAAARIKAIAGQRWSAAEAREVLRAQAKSGLSIHAFAKEHGLSFERLYRWRRQLELHATGEKLDEIAFAPVVLKNEHAAAALVIRFADAEVDVLDPAVVDPTWLSQLVRRLGER